MLISEQYAKENQRQHEMQNGYGISGHKHLGDVLELAKREKCASAIDYGCGQGSLALHAKRVSPLIFQNYDPAVPEYCAMPEPADLVVCTDVLEHIEPYCLHQVLNHLAELAQKAVFLNIATRPARRILSDGRNAHLIVKPPMWWLDTVRDHFDITEMRVVPGHSVMLAGKPAGSLYD